jgi:hypothetical protein
VKHVARRLLGRNPPPAQPPPPSGPTEPEIAASLLAAAQASEGAGLEAICQRALDEAPGELWILFEIGGVARDYGLNETAERIYRHIITRDPDAAWAAFHYARLCAFRGDDGEAWRALEAVKTPGVYAQYIDALWAQLHARRGELDKAAALLETVTEPAIKAEALAHMDFARFVAEFPRAEVMEMVCALERGPEFLDAAGVAGQARDALQARRGFSMVRIGDGEGAFLRISAGDDARFAALYTRNRVDRARVWFDEQLDVEASGFAAEMARIGEVMRDATVVGIPYPARIEHEFRLRSITGVSASTNILRWVAAERQGKLICCQDVHYELHRDGHLRALLQEAPAVGLLSCHPDLPQRLQRSFGLGEVEFHKLPGEQQMRRIIGPAAAEGRHYPDVFRGVMAALDRPLNGTLFLVAGGILGKFYCERIRASGGVAIDIGSVADSWVGAETRPTFDPNGVL